MIRPLLLLMPLVTLAACNRAPEINEKNASVDEVAARVREASGNASFVRAGEWQSKVVIEEFNIPGMPPEAIKQMKTAVAQNQQHSFKTCLTAKDVKQPKGTFFTGNKQCRYDHFTMGNGKIDAAMRCPSGQGMTQKMVMSGTYGPERYDMRMTMTGEGVEGPIAKMTMTMRVESTRAGDCNPDTPSAKVAG
ncbi:MAG: DUF3617 domain-containing protein [Sphingomicrobium sp.]